MYKLFLLFSILVLTSYSEVSKKTGKIILAILAHPDDEAAMASVLAKYAKSNTVHLIIATDGRYGIRPGFPTGDTLMKLRETESECACKILGVQPPVFLRFTDGFDTRIGVGNYFEKSYYMKEMLRAKIREIQPGVILTFGPDGDTGHSDHRMISNMVTEVVLNEGLLEQLDLYYLAWTKKESEKFKQVMGFGLNTIDSKYINATIDFSDEDEAKGLKSLSCYKSQLSADEIKQWTDAELKDSVNTLNFRKLTVSKEKRKDF
jgi:LmbE family N-acetylglucosaminyl deacetylase